ncbi:DNA recombination protein RmuC [Chitinophaga pendula]|uniref:DNA recombination protein RmuC n=1 Tax=Chitinophaga pendula TaxID=2849666 RepID=UPI001CECBBA5|nr:DNA recombination protein RmuC [Chitinophaga pendula]UCJ05272.1 DNA recombination protein RmuC [Chitinophaga pendula]
MTSLSLIISAALIIGFTVAWLIAKSNTKTITGNLQVAANRQVAMLQTTLEEQKILLAARNEELRQQQNMLTNALQTKTALETTLEQVNKTILELQNREQEALVRITDLQNTLTTVKEENASLDASEKATAKRLEEQQRFMTDAQQHLKDTFSALSAHALQNNNTSFVELAKAKLEEKVTEARGELDKKQQAIDAVVKPLAESLGKIDKTINDLEIKREGAYSNMNTLLDQMKQSTVALDKETRSLVSALKTSTSRGRYGEIALRRLVEFAGMMEYCDFQEQVSTDSDSGRLRPDMVIQLPGSRQVVVDSKVPLAAYLEVFETDEIPRQKLLMEKHVAAIKTHIKQLGSKAYWDQFPEAPDFVVMFMQIESSFGAALQLYPGIIEEALNNRIIIATPTTLITVLRSIGYCWNQIKTQENIDQIRDAAVEMYERTTILMDHITNIGKSLTATVSNYNKTVASLEGNFLPHTRTIHKYASASTKKNLSNIIPIDIATREVVAAPPQ